jgi:exonuclease SbcD
MLAGYWALAHVHQGAILHCQPYIVFCGNLQGRHIREAGPKGATLVSVRDGEIEDIASIHADVVRWALIQFSAEGSRRPFLGYQQTLGPAGTNNKD